MSLNNQNTVPLLHTPAHPEEGNKQARNPIPEQEPTQDGSIQEAALPAEPHTHPAQKSRAHPSKGKKCPPQTHTHTHTQSQHCDLCECIGQAEGWRKEEREEMSIEPKCFFYS
jgi:hypothetical protein